MFKNHSRKFIMAYNINTVIAQNNHCGELIVARKSLNAKPSSFLLIESLVYYSQSFSTITILPFIYT